MHPRTWFPLILFGLTLMLGLLVVFSIFPKLFTEQTNTVEIETPVDAEEYENQVHDIVMSFSELLKETDTDAEKIKLAQAAQNDLLALLVPAKYKDLHLELVVSMNLIAQGYQLEDESRVAEGERRLEAMIEKFKWLQ